MMTHYIALLRGINVGGKNKVAMSDLKNYLAEMGFFNVKTYIASGNVIFESEKKPEDIKETIEMMLIEKFELDDELIKVLVLSSDQFSAIIRNKPEGFGEQPETYHSDAIFLMDLETEKAMNVFDPKEGVDKVWPGDGVIYSQRLSALQTKSRLKNIMVSPLYKSMTIRSWQTVLSILEIINKASD